jgi:hypothetical protein
MANTLGHVRPLLRELAVKRKTADTSSGIENLKLQQTRARPGIVTASDVPRHHTGSAGMTAQGGLALLTKSPTTTRARIALQFTAVFLALLTDPWVFGSARQVGAVAAEGEHG